VEALELRRLLGPGRVVVDERGVTYRGLVSTTSLAWDEIVDYRLTARLSRIDRSGPHLTKVIRIGRIAIRPPENYRDFVHLRFGIAVLGGTRHVRLDWQFDQAEFGIAMILDRLCRPLGRRARAAFERDGIGRFGPLTLADHGIAWHDKPALPRERVDRIDLFDGSRSELRVMTRGKARPHASAQLADIPNLVAALDLARALGYPVHGRERLGAIGV
jgi:hypothetical protein